MNILEEYLKKLNSHMQDLLSTYNDVTIYETEEDIKIGLLRFDKPPKGKAFLFKFKNQEVREFTTIGMCFPIKIFFFNKDEQIVYSYGEVSPGIEIISSKKPCQYVVEIP